LNLILPSLPLALEPTPVDELTRLRTTLGTAPRLLIKRDDAIRFAFGGNKVRKMRVVGADAVAQRADTLITSGGVQSNHARVTAATASKLGRRCVLVVNGSPPQEPTGNARLDRLLGADVRYVRTRDERASMMETVAAEERAAGRRPYVIPIGASIPLGAAAFVQAVFELLEQIPPPDVILHASSSGGTQAGLVAGCALAGVRTRVIGISADEPAEALAAQIRSILAGLPRVLGVDENRFETVSVDVDDSFVGGGYGVPTEASTAALDLLARTEALFLDPTYTAKAMAALIAYLGRGAFSPTDTLLFWHTGGQVALFA
jgi:L-cysteate sulfo-lyase